MFRRFMGLVLIVSVFMPIVLSVAGYFAVRQLVGDIENAAREPLARINDRLDGVRETLDGARGVFQSLSNLISSIANRLGGVFSGIGGAINALSIRVPSISIPDINFRFPSPIGRLRIPVPNIPEFELPGLRQAKSVLSSLYSALGGVFGDLTDALRRIATLGSLPQELNQVVVEVRGLVDDVREIGNRWLSTVGLIAVVLGIWLIVTYVALIYRWLSAGWRMLRGLPDN